MAVKEKTATVDEKAMKALEAAPDVAAAVAPGYTPTAKEAVAIRRTQERLAARPSFPGFSTKTDNGVATIAIAHADETAAVALQLNAVGLASYQEFSSILSSVLNFTMSNKGTEVNANAATEAMHLIVGIGPQNTTETMLATQMAAIHLATMEAARKMNKSPTSVEAIACNSKVLNNLARTFAVQTETLKKLRSNGPQHVVVEHKHYHLHRGPDGTGGGVETESEGKPHERSLSERPAVLGYLETNGMQMQGASGEGLEGVPVPRGKGRGAGRGH